MSNFIDLDGLQSNIMGSDLCGKTVKLRNSSTGKVVMAKVADTW